MWFHLRKKSMSLPKRNHQRINFAAMSPEELAEMFSQSMLQNGFCHHISFKVQKILPRLHPDAMPSVHLRHTQGGAGAMLLIRAQVGGVWVDHILYHTYENNRPHYTWENLQVAGVSAQRQLHAWLRNKREKPISSKRPRTRPHSGRPRTKRTNTPPPTRPAPTK